MPAELNYQLAFHFNSIYVNTHFFPRSTLVGVILKPMMGCGSQSPKRGRPTRSVDAQASIVGVETTIDDVEPAANIQPGATPKRRIEDPLHRVFGGRYQVREQLGQGGFSEVFRAEGICPDGVARSVAIKCLRQSMRHEPTPVARLHREAKLLRRLSHPGLPRLFDWLPAEYAIVMERVPGQSLSVLFDGSYARELSTVRVVFTELLGILSYLHAQQVSHRDVKPANVLLRWPPQGALRVTLLDLGLASRPRAVLSQPLRSGSLTGSGIPIGSPRYMSPEHCRGRDVGPAADLYAVGVMLYEALCGRHPFAASSAVDFMAAHLSALPASVPVVTLEHSALLNLALWALAKEPLDRPTAEELRDALSASKSDR